ncbi:MAG TPA: mechanosensitive ion channel family protein [Acetobacteraceae bacterium]|nr:mechanosensitive ion channel family protein [Acetobacteraceae bacterium]
MRTDGLTVVLEKVDSALAWAPPWLAGIVVLVGSAAIALLLYNWALRLLGRIGARYGTLPQLLIDKGRGPVAAVLLVMVLGAALPAANFSHAVTLALGHVLLVAFVLAVGWGLNAALALSATIYLSRFRVDLADNLLARKHVTQVRILQRAIQVLILIVTAGTALMTINAVRQFGVSLFASAGAAGLVVGLAARPVLSNLLAGIQIALAQPIRVEDAVVVENEWGWIEEINSTYVVVRIWDLRRLILPLTYFIEKPFQNWTHRSADLLGSVHLNVDWTVPVDRLREELNRIVHESKLWDGKVVVLQVVESIQNVVQLRALVSARNSGQAWDLRCEVREKLVAFLQREYPRALPRQRVEMDADAIRALMRNERGSQQQRPTVVRPDAA